ncbi:Unknown protein [Striga hermonthica]|uniref:Ubiquitin-like protease family profile domain-containing protein n=1 Tax=Striga hermonthica TaxID=68872 RepID=A0A9N7RRI3_STRHE|nr:Unknown protein [Striga hermonthica]
MSGMGGIGRKKSQEVHIVLSDSSSYASSNAASEEVSSKLLNSKNDTKSPLKSHAKIINLYACMLTWDKRNDASKIPVENWFLPTYVSQFITKMKKGCDVGCIYRYFLREDKYGGDIQKCEKIFIPMNPGDHWYLCVVDIINEEVMILDSLMPKNCNERISSAKVVLKCLHEALEIGCGTTYSINIPLFPTRMAQWAPQQKNLYDCGLFTIRFMQLYDKLRAGMHLSIDNSYLERRKIAIEIFYHQANETKEEILRKIVHSSEAVCPAATP